MIFLKKQKIVITLFVIVGGLLFLLLYQYFNNTQYNVFSKKEDTTPVSIEALGISFDYNPDDFVVNESMVDNTVVLVMESDDLHILMKESDDLSTFFSDTPLRNDNVLDDFLSLERRDHSGFFGYKLRNIDGDLEKKQDYLIYRFYRGDKILEIVCRLKRTENPQVLEEKIDDFVTSIHFDAGSENPQVMVKQNALFSVGESQKEYLMNLGQVTESAKYSTNNVVANKTMGIEVLYDSQFVSMTNNQEVEIYGGPEIRFNGKNVSIVIREEDVNFPYFIDTENNILRMTNLMTITRFDRSGYAGQRRWSWLIQNEQKDSRIEYRIKRNDKILLVDAWIENTDPESVDFYSMQSRVDDFVRSMEFTEVNDREDLTLINELGIKVDSGVFNNN